MAFCQSRGAADTHALEQCAALDRIGKAGVGSAIDQFDAL